MLTLITIQDFKEKAIVWYLLPIIVFLSFLLGIQNVSYLVLIKNFLINLLFILIQLILLFFYFVIKNKKIIKIINNYIGLGDILFLISICILFSPINFFLFYLFSLILILFISFITKYFIKNVSTMIPLAGYMACFLILILSSTFFYNTNLYNDYMFLSTLK